MNLGLTGKILAQVSDVFDRLGVSSNMQTTATIESSRELNNMIDVRAGSHECEVLLRFDNLGVLMSVLITFHSSDSKGLVVRQAVPPYCIKMADLIGK